MSIRPFLSATKDDLDPDCRPDAIEAIRLAGAEPVTMETWDAEYEDAVKVCCDKIKGSTHYIGIFAFRRGWTPPELQKSITEAEFDWANDLGKPMVVFLPDPRTPFGLELKKRASNQTLSESQAQEIFLAKVKKKHVLLFDKPSQLTTKIALRIERWTNSFLDRQTQAPQNRENDSGSKWRRPDEIEINKLGRTDQERDFEDSLNVILRTGWPKAICFLISGPGGHGHARLAARFRKKIETKPGVKQYAVAVGAMWSRATSDRLVEVIGSSIERNWAPQSIEALAERLGKMLKESDVVLEIANIQRLAEAVREFSEKFWQPLVAALGEGSPYRLIVLATLEAMSSLDAEEYLQPPLKKAAVTFDPRQLIKLPELSAFEEEELFNWLQNGGWVKPENAAAFAKVLMTETHGMPEMLCLKLADDSTWIV